MEKIENGKIHLLCVDRNGYAKIIFLVDMLNVMRHDRHLNQFVIK